MGEGSAKQWQMAVDLERCIGCHACSVACKTEHDVELGVFRTKVYYADHGSFPHIRRGFLPALCMQCADAPCLKACPSDAIFRSSDGIVHIDEHVCDAHGDCIKACPYGALYLDPATQVADKCDFCSNRLEQDMHPACVEACPTNVLIFGDARDPASSISRFKKQYGPGLSALKEQRGTGPNVLYRGLDDVTPRAIEAKLPEGRNHDPRSYEIGTWANGSEEV